MVLLLLDLSPAFDLVDHEILLERLSTWFGLKGKVLARFKSYLENRSQFVKIDGSSINYGILLRSGNMYQWKLLKLW